MSLFGHVQALQHDFSQLAGPSECRCKGRTDGCPQRRLVDVYSNIVPLCPFLDLGQRGLYNAVLILIFETSSEDTHHGGFDYSPSLALRQLVQLAPQDA